jgi:hypothetical protein
VFQSTETLLVATICGVVIGRFGDVAFVKVLWFCQPCVGFERAAASLIRDEVAARGVDR